MWVFGYGSLMWDGWERAFGGARAPGAQLRGFHRDFNKASSENWGTRVHRGPTLGLEPDPDAVVVGVAFEFSDDKRASIHANLTAREGASFALDTHRIMLPNGREVDAIVPVNSRQARTYIGTLSLAQRVNMTLAAKGTSGSCMSYALTVRDHLRSLNIADAHVDEFVVQLQRRVSNDESTDR